MILTPFCLTGGRASAWACIFFSEAKGKRLGLLRAAQDGRWARRLRCGLASAANGSLGHQQQIEDLVEWQVCVTEYELAP